MKFHLWISFLFLVNFQIAIAQKFEKFTKEEKNLITSKPDEKMRVTQLNDEKDSLILKSISIPIDPKNKLTKQLAVRMLLSVNDPEHKGVGIAAPQVGLNRRMILVQRFDKEEKPFEIFINPEIIWESKLIQKGGEGDLSFEERGLVYRNYSIQINYTNLEGDNITEILEGFTAVIFQHERDHLDGILLTDRIIEQKKQSFSDASINSDLYFVK